MQTLNFRSHHRPYHLLHIMIPINTTQLTIYSICEEYFPVLVFNFSDNVIIILLNRCAHKTSSIVLLLLHNVTTRYIVRINLSIESHSKPHNFDSYEFADHSVSPQQKPQHYRISRDRRAIQKHRTQITNAICILKYTYVTNIYQTPRNRKVIGLRFISSATPRLCGEIHLFPPVILLSKTMIKIDAVRYC